MFIQLLLQDQVMAERDYLKEELGLFLEQIGKLEKENAYLSEELREKKSVEEFEIQEEEIRKEETVSHARRSGLSLVVHAWFWFFWFQDTLKREVCDLKKAAEGSDLQRQELQVEVLPSGLGSQHRRWGGR